MKGTVIEIYGFNLNVVASPIYYVYMCYVHEHD